MREIIPGAFLSKHKGVKSSPRLTCGCCLDREKEGDELRGQNPYSALLKDSIPPVFPWIFLRSIAQILGPPAPDKGEVGGSKSTQAHPNQNQNKRDSSHFSPFLGIPLKKRPFLVNRLSTSRGPPQIVTRPHFSRTDAFGRARERGSEIVISYLTD